MSAPRPIPIPGSRRSTRRRARSTDRQPGETVYLRAGTGTYAEADGINLLNGQILIGGGQDLIVGGDLVESGTGRPTIATTGAGNHGVELAQNNTVSGFDIGTTTGAGISDGGGSVGNLTISDVGKIGRRPDRRHRPGRHAQRHPEQRRLDRLDRRRDRPQRVSAAASPSPARPTIVGVHTGGGVDVTDPRPTHLSTFARRRPRLDRHGDTASTSPATAAAWQHHRRQHFDITTTSGTARSAVGDRRHGHRSAAPATTSPAPTGIGVVIRATPSSGGVTLESVSSIGGNTTGIILDNAGTGGFAVTGLGSTAGSGGTINSKTGADGSLTAGRRRLHQQHVNVSLANMAITAAPRITASGAPT